MTKPPCRSNPRDPIQSNFHAAVAGITAACIAVIASGCAAPHGAGAPSTQRTSTIVLAGGGGEGQPGDASAWSARLYKHMLDGGDITGDGKIRIALLAARPHTEWLCKYLTWLGANEAFNVCVGSVAAADDPQLDIKFRHVDAVFIKGGDQGIDYDLWNDRRIERIIRDIHARGGAIGGTSAGAMALAQFALAGSKGVTSEQVLADSRTVWLDDASDRGTAIHNDFLGLVPNVIIDSHFNQRHRFERLLGALAKAREDNDQPGMAAIGLDEKTGLVIQGEMMTVIGQGTVTILSANLGCPSFRAASQPAMIANLRFSQLIDGCQLHRGQLTRLPNGAPYQAPARSHTHEVFLGAPPATRPVALRSASADVANP